MSGKKVMVIGLDAATLDLVRPWAAAGRLPNLQRFMEQGAVGTLRSTLPVMSPAAWSTFATGLNPGKHGIIDFCQLAADSYDARFVNARDRRGRTFWEIAGDHGRKGGVINVPITYPPRAYNGFIISGVLSPGVRREMASPPEVFDDLLAASPDYAVDVDLLAGGGDLRQQFLDRALRTAEARTRAAVGLYRRYRPELFCVVFMAADRVSHYFWHYHEEVQAGRRAADDRLGRAIALVYEKLDEAVGRLLAEADDETDVLILSDHGAGPLRGGLNMRKVLAGAGLLAEARPGALGRLAKGAIETFARVAPTSLKSRIKARLGGLARRAATVVARAGIDFSRTRAYPTGDSAGVFVNLKGRQPQGLVEPGEEYEAVRDEIIKVFTELTDPRTGRAVAKKVYRREEVFSGPCVEALPDVIMEQEDYLYATTLVAEAAGDEVFYDLPDDGAPGLHRHGDHRREGLLMAMGPHIKRHDLAGAEIADVPATVLALLGCPIPADFDGRALVEMFTPDVPPPQLMDAGQTGGDGGGEVYSPQDRKAIEERLKGLGYL